MISHWLVLDIARNHFLSSASRQISNKDNKPALRYKSSIHCSRPLFRTCVVAKWPRSQVSGRAKRFAVFFGDLGQVGGSPWTLVVCIYECSLQVLMYSSFCFHFALIWVLGT